MMPASGRVGLLAVLPAMLLAVGALAEAPRGTTGRDRLDDALAMWDTATARALLESSGEPARGRGAVTWGYLLFLEGDYRRAEETLGRAPAEDMAARRLRDRVRATRAATRDLATAVSPGGRFEVRFRAGLDDAVLPYLFEAAEAAWDAITRRFGPDGPARIRIEVLTSLASLAAASGLTEDEIGQSGAVAVCKFNKLMMVSPSALPWGYPYADTVSHELVHFVLTLRGGEGLPVWLQEAMAKYLEPVWRGAAPGELPAGARERLASAMASGRLVPFTTLTTSLAKLPAESVGLAFTELSTFAAFLEREHGPQVFLRLVKAMSAGDADAGFRLATGRQLQDAVAEWLKYLAGLVVAPSGARLAGVIAGEADEDLARRMTPDAAAAVRLGDLLRGRGRPAAAAVEYRKAASSLAEPHPAVVARTGAALLEASAPEQALTVLDAARLDEDEYPVLAGIRGRALVVMGRHRDALPHLLAAVRTDPYDPAIHEALERAFSATGDTQAAERERRLAGMWR